MCVAFSQNGKRLLSSAADGTVRVWDVRTGRQLLALCAPGETVRSAAFSPDDTRIISSGGGTTVKLWDADTGVELLTLGRDGVLPVHAVAFSPDGKRIAMSVDWGPVRILDSGSWDDASVKQRGGK